MHFLAVVPYKWSTARALLTVERPIKHWKHEQGQCGRRNDSANHNRGERTLHFRAATMGQSHWQKAEGRNERGHKDRTESRNRANPNRFLEGVTFVAKTRDEGDHHHAIEHRDSGKGDETDAGGNGERETTQPKRKNTAS